MPCAAAPSVSIVETDDVDAQRQALAWWDQDYAQLSTGHFRGRTTEVDFGPIRIFREQLSARIEQVFVPPAGTVTFTLQVADNKAPSRLAGIEVSAHAFCVLEGGREFHVITDQDSDILCVEIDSARLGDIGGTGPARRPPVWTADRTRPTAWWLVSVLECFANGGPADGGSGLLGDLAIDSCRGLLAAGDERQRPGGGQAARFDLVRRAREMVLDTLADPPDTATLAAALRVSQRTLEQAFHDILGMGPVSWLRLQRLNRAHRDLRHATPDDTIAQVATRWGFWHLGRFSGAYRQLFGCPPSHTLRQSPGGGHDGGWHTAANRRMA